MGRVQIMCLAFVTVLAGLVSTAPANGKALPEPEPVVFYFNLDGSNGYEIHVIAASERGGGRGHVALRVGGKGRETFYLAPARVTPTAIKADLGSLGRIDAVLRPSGVVKEVRYRCVDYTEAFEPGVFEGTFEFTGEERYTRADQGSAPLLAPALGFENGSCHGSGSGEATGSGLPGARLRGLSFVHGRALKFQFNKNRPSSKAVFTASLRERHDGVQIAREVQGTAPANAFSFDRSLRSAVLRPPAPFSGRASLSRSRDSFVRPWRGALALDFLGRSDVALAGSGVFVTLVHARFTRSNSPEAEIGFRLLRDGAWLSTQP
jgi:hypothetical protein